MAENLTSKAVDLAIAKAAQVAEKEADDPINKRVKRYLGCMLSQDVEGLFEALLEDMDKEKILIEVQELKNKNPQASVNDLAALEINTTAKALSGVAIGSGLAWVIPGVALLTGPLALAGELVGLFVFQSRLIVKIAALHDVDIKSEERARDVAVCVACSSMSSATSKLSGKAAEAMVAKFGAKLAEVAAQKLAQAGVRSIPGIGALAGVVGGAVGAVSNFYAVKAVGAYALKMYGNGTTPSLLDQPFDIALIKTAVLVAQAHGEVRDSEMAYIESVIDEASLTQETRSSVLESLHETIDVDSICNDLSDSEKEALLLTAIKISMADHVIENKERDAMLSLGKRLCLENAFVEKAIEDYVNATENELNTGSAGPETLNAKNAAGNSFLSPGKWLERLREKKS